MGKKRLCISDNNSLLSPVIVLTGAPNVKDANTLFTEGIVEYLMKPVQPEDLVQAVEKAAQSHDFFKGQFCT